MALFDDRERAFLSSIKNDPAWRSILNKMCEFSGTPRYRADRPEGKQVYDWIYESGRLDERESIVSLLNLSRDKLKLEK